MLLLQLNLKIGDEIRISEDSERTVTAIKESYGSIMIGCGREVYVLSEDFILRKDGKPIFTIKGE